MLGDDPRITLSRATSLGTSSSSARGAHLVRGCPPADRPATVRRVAHDDATVDRSRAPAVRILGAILGAKLPDIPRH